MAFRVGRGGTETGDSRRLKAKLEEGRYKEKETEVKVVNDRLRIAFAILYLIVRDGGLSKVGMERNPGLWGVKPAQASNSF